jgi:hypothetical protein
MMPMIQGQDTTIEYIRERRCSSGGYCFYRLDEPNAGDTFHALASLAMLDALPDNDVATREYLYSFQNSGKHFSNVNVRYAIARSLLLLGEKSDEDPASWILPLLIPPRDSIRPAESSSLFEYLYLLTDLCTIQNVTIPSEKKAEIITAVLHYHHKDTGFGHPVSTIIETADALAILAALGYPVSSAGSTEFLKQCEDPASGFLAVPGSKPGYLEHIHAGVLACSVLGYPSPLFVQCQEFIRKCCSDNGGYVRSMFGGSPNLENTWLALDTLAIIGRMSKDPTRRQDAGNPLRCCD